MLDRWLLEQLDTLENQDYDQIDRVPTEKLSQEVLEMLD